MVLGGNQHKPQKLWTKLGEARDWRASPSASPSPSKDVLELVLGDPAASNVVKTTGLVQPSHFQIKKLRPRVGSDLPKFT